MRKIRPDYEFPIEGRAWTQGSLPSADVFFLDGDCHIVARNGPAAFELEERGALLIGVVRFDGGAPERVAPGETLRPLDPREAVARFAPSGRGDENRRAGRLPSDRSHDHADS